MAVINVILIFLQIYMLCMLVYAVISWLPMIAPSLAYNDVVVSVRRFLDSVIEPYVRLFRNVIPPVSMGGSQIDLSFMVAFFALIVISRVVGML